MTVGYYPAKRDIPCDRCKDTIRQGETAWYVKGKRGYWCGHCQEEWEQKNASGYHQTPTTMTSTAAQTTPEAARLSPSERIAHLEEENKDLRMQMADREWRSKQINEAHSQNMESARQTRDVLANLTVAIVTLRDAITGMKR